MITSDFEIEVLTSIFPDAEIMKWTDETGYCYGIYYDGRHEVIRLPAWEASRMTLHDKITYILDKWNDPKDIKKTPLYKVMHGN